MDKALLKAIITAHLAPGKAFAGKKIKSITPFGGGDIELSIHDENKVYGIDFNCFAKPANEEVEPVEWGAAEAAFGFTKHEGNIVSHIESIHDTEKAGTNYMGPLNSIVFRYAKFTNAQGWGSGWVVTLEDA